MKISVIKEIKGCRDPCPYCTTPDTWSGISCQHPSFGMCGKGIMRPSPIVMAGFLGDKTFPGYGLAHNDIPKTKLHPDWCPLYLAELQQKAGEPG